MKKKLNPLSLISLLVSALGFFAFAGCFESAIYHPIFFVLTIASLVLPPIAKKTRLQTETSGKWMEITAIVIAGFNFSSVIIYFLRLPDLVSYLGWIVDGIVYHKVQYHVTTVSAQRSQPPAPPAQPQKSEETTVKQPPDITVPSDESVSIFMDQTDSCNTVKELLDFWNTTPLAGGIKGEAILELLQKQSSFERIYGSDAREFDRTRKKIAAMLAEP